MDTAESWLTKATMLGAVSDVLLHAESNATGFDAMWDDGYGDYSVEICAKKVPRYLVSLLGVIAYNLSTQIILVKSLIFGGWLQF